MLVNDRQMLELILTKVTAIETDVSTLKSDVSTLKSDVNELRSDVNKLRSDVDKLRTDVDKLRADVDKLDTRVDVILTQTAKLSEYHNETLSILNEIREEHKSIKELLVDHEIAIRTLKRKPV